MKKLVRFRKKLILILKNFKDKKMKLPKRMMKLY